jgi:ABC-type uncharacterized transport system permease subunit
MSTQSLFGLYESGFLLLAVFCYLGATLLLWARIFFRADEQTASAELWHRIAGHSGLSLLAVGTLSHGVSLLGQGRELLAVTPGVAGLFGWILAMACLLFSRLERGAPVAFLVPVALLAALYSLADAPLHREIQPRQLEMQWLAVHVVIILIGYAALAFAFASSVIYLIQEGLLKRKKLTGLWQRLPALHDADEMIFRATSFGLAMLTVGIFTALIWMQYHPEYAALSDPKVLVSLVTWLIFATYVAVRQGLGWRGRRTNLVVVYGFLLLAISFFGVPHIVSGR